MLSIDRLNVNYGAIRAVRDVNLHVGGGEIVGLVGPNGAGKTTTLEAVAGLLRPGAGSVRFDGEDITGKSPDTLLRRGLALVPEQRRLFPDLTVRENLLAGGVTATAGQRKQRMDESVALFPVLGDKFKTMAGYLSGGEAQQLAIARALMSDPKLLLMDEPSLGLAPSLVDHVFDLIVRMGESGRTLLVIEQNARRLLGVADRAYLMRTGSVVASGTGEELLAREDLFDQYVGLS